MSELAGQVAIVTGGGRGIGRAICERLAGEGCALVVNYHASRRAADELVAAIQAGTGQAVAVGGSIADPATGPSLAAAALEQFGRIDILVNNAGITRDVTVRKMSDADFTEIIETNLVGTHRVTKAVLDHLCEAGHGRIVSIASFVAQLGTPA